MTDITVIILTKNEQINIARCINFIKNERTIFAKIRDYFNKLVDE